MAELPEEFDESELRSSLEAIRSQTAVFEDVETLAFASMSVEEVVVPKQIVDALLALFAIWDDDQNGGMDQVVWNHGIEGARFYAAAFDAVGAVENAELLARLADAVEPHLAEKSDEPVQAFQRFRKEVDGPFFGLPELHREAPEAVLEWSFEHADEFDYTG